MSLLAAALLGLVGAPQIRYFDDHATLRTEPVAEVLEEKVSIVRVRRADGTELAVPGTHLVSLTREREEVAEEGALLRARMLVEGGLDLDDARATLDRILPKSEGWMREYAEAARADLARKRREPEARARIDAFLRDRPESRFVPQALLSLAALKSDADGNTPGSQMHFAEAFKRIQVLGGPRIWQGWALAEPAFRVSAAGGEDARMFLYTQEQNAIQMASKTDDPVWKVCLRSVQMWARIAFVQSIRAEVSGIGEKPVGPRFRFAKMREEVRYLPEEIRCDVAYELGATQRLCAEDRDALASFRESLELAPDPWRRLRAERAIALFGSVPEGEREKPEK